MAALDLIDGLKHRSFLTYAHITKLPFSISTMVIICRYSGAAVRVDQHAATCLLGHNQEIGEVGFRKVSKQSQDDRRDRKRNG